MKPLFKRVSTIAHPQATKKTVSSQILQPLKPTLLTLLFTVAQVPLQYLLLESISSGGKALAQAQTTSCPAGTSPTTLEWNPTTNVQDILSQTLSVGGIRTTINFAESDPEVIDPGETRLDSAVYGGIAGPNLRFNIGGNSLNKPQRDANPAPVGSSATLTITFAQPVTLASPLTLMDIDRNGARDGGRIFQDRVTVRAVNGTSPVGLTARAIGRNTRVTNQGNSILAEGIRENAENFENDGNIEVTPSGQVSQIQILYEPGTEYGTPGQDETVGLARIRICGGRGSIGDTVFQDLNGNGTQEPDEVGLGGVRVRLFGSGPDGVINTPDDNLIAEQLTDNSPNIIIGGRGNYTFNNLPPGVYRVESDTPPGAPPNDRAFLTTGQNPIIVNLGPDQNFLNADFGFNMTGFSGNNPGSIGDTVFNDRNGNGVQDSDEPGVPNVSLTLTLPGPDGRLGTPDDTTQTTTTNNDGKYSFNVPPGPYRVGVNPPFNLPQVTTGGNQVDITLSSGQTLNNVDFGLRLPPGGTIGDTVFNDTNGDRTFNSGETGIPNATLTLRNASGQTVATTTSDNNGKYLFTGLPLGSYTVDVTRPGSLNPTTNTTLSANLTEANPDNLDVDFGFNGGRVGAAQTGLRLVKRITNVFRNGQLLNVGNFNTFVDDPNDDNDNILQQAGRAPVGVIQLETPLQSSDEVEYTIYYLAEGDEELRNVRFCDLIPAETSYSSGDISLNQAGTLSSLTNAQDSDQGAFFTPLQPLPSGNTCLSQTNSKGAVILNLGTVTPDRNFGFLRFRVRID